MKIFILTITTTILASSIAYAESFSPEAAYNEVCSTCHGFDGEGISADIPDFSAKRSVLKKADDQLIKSLLNGVQKQDGTEVMPAYGGADEFTKEQARMILRFLRENFGS